MYSKIHLNLHLKSVNIRIITTNTLIAEPIYCKSLQILESTIPNAKIFGHIEEFQSDDSTYSDCLEIESSKTNSIAICTNETNGIGQKDHIRELSIAEKTKGISFRPLTVHLTGLNTPLVSFSGGTFLCTSIIAHFHFPRLLDWRTSLRYLYK